MVNRLMSSDRPGQWGHWATPAEFVENWEKLTPEEKLDRAEYILECVQHLAWCHAEFKGDG